MPDNTSPHLTPEEVEIQARAATAKKCFMDEHPSVAIAARQYHRDVTKLLDSLAAARRELAEAKRLLALVYDAWEDGPSCYEDPDDFTGYLGKAIRLDDADENAILAALKDFPLSAPPVQQEPGK
jgi:hypothetical protein